MTLSPWDVPESAADRRASGVEELSQLLLQGWTMLADTCPNPSCHMPLARSRDGRVICCSCRLEVVSPSSARVLSTTDQVTSHAVGQNATLSSSPVSGQNDSLNGGSENTRNADENIVGNAEGERLTDGIGNSRSFVSTPSPPMGAQSSSAIVPAGIGMRSSDISGSSMAGAPRRNAAGRRRDDASAAMGEKLLQGWTMLQEPCARCNTPLLRNGIGTLLCVVCTPPHLPSVCTQGNELDGRRGETDLGLSGGGVVGGRPDCMEDRCDEVPETSTALATRSVTPSPATTSATAAAVAAAVATTDTTVARAGSGSRGIHVAGPTSHRTPFGMNEVGMNMRMGVPGLGHALRVGRGGERGLGSGGGYRGINGERLRLESGHGMPALLPGPSGEDFVHGEDVGGLEGTRNIHEGEYGEATAHVIAELTETERAVVMSLGRLRGRLAALRDVEAIKATCEAIQVAADAIYALRRAAASLMSG